MVRVSLLLLMLTALSLGPSLASAKDPNAPVALKLAARDAIAAVGDTAHLKATVNDLQGAPVGGVDIVFTLFGIDIGHKTSAANGEATFDLVTTEALKIGANPYGVKLTGRTPVQASANLAMVKSATRISPGQGSDAAPGLMAMGATNGSSHALSVSGRLMRITDNATLYGRTIHVVVAGKPATTTTNGTGDFTATVPLGAGDIGKTIAITATFDGDAHYLAGGSSMTMLIPGPPASPPDFNYHVASSVPATIALGQTADIAVVMKTAKGAPIPGATVHVTASGANPAPHGQTFFQTLEIGVGKTDSQGKLTFHYLHTARVQPGSYELSLRWQTDGREYMPGSTTEEHRGKILIASTPTATKVTAPTTAKVGATIHIDVALTTDQHPIYGTFHLSTPTKDYGSFQTDSPGHASIDVVMPTTPGAQAFTVQLSELDPAVYASSSATFVVDVLP